MKSGRIFWGVFFVLVGLFFLADRYDLFTIGWDHLWQFWPLVLISIGAAILLRGSRYKWIPLVIGAACLAILVASIFSFSWVGGEWETHRDAREQSFRIPLSDTLANASLSFEGGAGSLEVSDGDSMFFEATTHASFGEYTFDYDSSGGRRDIRVSFEGSHKGWRLGKLDNYAILKLHPVPSWDLDLNLGASNIDIDFSRLAVERLNLNTGAARAKIRMGSRADDAQVDVNAGASSITIRVPEKSGCEIQVDAPLSSKHFRGFTKVGDGDYETDNYSSAEKKISIRIHAGVSSIKVERY
jgi:hypothetical protein